LERFDMRQFENIPELLISASREQRLEREQAEHELKWLRAPSKRNARARSRPVDRRNHQRAVCARRIKSI
jgi:hypothetical protein